MTEHREQRDAVVAEAIRTVVVPDHEAGFWERLDDAFDAEDETAVPTGNTIVGDAETIELGSVRPLARRSSTWLVAAAAALLVGLVVGVAVTRVGDDASIVDVADDGPADGSGGGTADVDGPQTVPTEATESSGSSPDTSGATQPSGPDAPDLLEESTPLAGAVIVEEDADGPGDAYSVRAVRADDLYTCFEIETADGVFGSRCLADDGLDSMELSLPDGSRFVVGVVSGPRTARVEIDAGGAALTARLTDVGPVRAFGVRVPGPVGSVVAVDSEGAAVSSAGG